MRDNTVVTPVVTAVSGFLAIIAVGMRVLDSFPVKEIQWADMCAVASLVRGLPFIQFKQISAKLS